MVPLDFAVGHLILPELHVLYLRFAAMSDIESELRSTGVPKLRTIQLPLRSLFRVLRKSTAIQHIALEMPVNRWYPGAMEKEIVGRAQDVACWFGEAEDGVRSLHATEPDFEIHVPWYWYMLYYGKTHIEERDQELLENWTQFAKQLGV
jgi:hypothetical protein